MANGGPLSGIRVIDLSHFTAGPMCTKLLVDAGADVICIEPITGEPSRNLPPQLVGPDGQTDGSLYVRLGFDKRSVALDLKKPEGKDVLWRLLNGADVLVESFRPGVIDRLGFGYERVHERLPTLVYVSVSGFGQPDVGDGPYVSRPSYDPIIQAMSGLAAVTPGPEQRPGLVGASIGDTVPGMMAAYGTALAILQRETTGSGTHVDIAQYDVMLLANDRNISRFLNTGVEARAEHAVPYVPYGIFPAADGDLVIALATETQWRAFCDVIGRPDLVHDPRTSDVEARDRNYTEYLLPILLEWLSTRPRDVTVDAMLDAGVPAGPVQRVEDIARCPQVVARHLIRRAYRPGIGQVYGLADVVRLRDAPPRVHAAPPPALGQHTREVLLEAGLSADDIDRLETNAVIRHSPTPSASTPQRADY